MVVEGGSGEPVSTVRFSVRREDTANPMDLRPHSIFSRARNLCKSSRGHGNSFSVVTGNSLVETRKRGSRPSTIMALPEPRLSCGTLQSGAETP